MDANKEQLFNRRTNGPRVNVCSDGSKRFAHEQPY